MIAIVCVDDNNGMMFNNRRQSRDKTITERIIKISENSTLWMNEYSRKLFADNSNICVSDTFLSECKENEFAFIENCSLLPFEEKLTKLIIFKWNCTYPYDLQLDISPEKWKLVSTEDFIGNSHEKITMEVYER